MPLFLRYALMGVVVIAAQWLVLGRLRLWGAYPDAVLLYVVWLALRFGRFTGMLGGFGVGLVMDALYGTWGIQAFTKTLLGFLVGLFPAEDRASLTIRPQQVFVGGLFAALLHNGLQVVFYALQAGTRNTFMIFSLWLGAAIYTAAVGTIAALFMEK
jgi:rod shape-determining protein MreD